MLLRSYLLAALLLATSAVTSQLVAMNECGKTKTCLNMPSTCHGPDCESLIAWSRRPNDDYVSFEFSTRLRSADWFAVSFSEDLKIVIINSIQFNNFISEVDCIHKSRLNIGFRKW